VNLDECASYPCASGGTCVDWIFTYVCVCNAGFAGYNCEVDVNECASSPCMHGATCVDSLISSLVPSAYYQCACGAGFTGYNCETDVNECSSLPCQNGATCSQKGADAYACSCIVGFTGVNCDVDANECGSLPCMNTGICLDSSSLIQVGSKTAFGKYKCSCKAGFTGFNCETDINECVSSPCANGASCVESGTQVGFETSVSLKLSKSYVSSLGSTKASADGKLTAAELLKDPEGAALLASLQSQIASNLGVPAKYISITNIATKSVQSGRRLMAQSSAAQAEDFAEDDSQLDDARVPTTHGEEYYTVPSAAELAAMPTSSLRAVKNFRVGRVGYGEVRWLGDTDITGVDLNTAVSINRGEVSVYKGLTKPPVDSKLNKPAVVVLERVSPPKGVRAERFGEKLNEALTKAGAMPIAYQVSTGQWTFAVPNFMEA